MFGAAYITIRYEEHKRRETLRELTDRKTNLDDTFQNTESFSIVNDVYVMNKPVRRMDMIEVSDILGPNRVDSSTQILLATCNQSEASIILTKAVQNLNCGFLR